MDWQGLAKIHRKIDLGLASDRHWISIGLAWIGKKMDRMILDWSKECPWIGIWLAPDWNMIGPGLVWDWSGIDIWLSQIGMDCQELARGLANMYYWLGWKVDIGLALSWHRIGQDWHWLARTGHDWLELIMIGNAQFHPPSRLGTIPYRQLVLWLRT